MGFERILKKETSDAIKSNAKEIVDWLIQSKENEVYYIVPDHIKFSAELKMFEEIKSFLSPESNEFSSLRFHVVSFSRLAWHFLKDDSIMGKSHISKIGQAMILQKVLIKHQEELILFRHEMKHVGFLEQLMQLFQEFRQAGIEPQDFDEFLTHEMAPSMQDSPQKLKEFSILYRSYQKELQSKYVESEELLLALAKKIEELDFSKTFFIIDHYYSFNANELKVLQALHQHASRLQIQFSLPLEHLSRENETQSLYYSNQLLFNRVSQVLSASYQEPVLTREIFDKNQAYRPDFLEIEQYWLESSSGVLKPLQPRFTTKIENIHITSYLSKTEEFRETLAQIQHMVKYNSYRYKDFQILLRSLEEDQLYLQPLLKEFNIPHFLDLQHSMESHILLSVIENIFTMHQKPRSSDEILNLLRTQSCFWPIWVQDFTNDTLDNQERLTHAKQVLNEFRGKVDICENIVLEFGLRHHDWLSENTWSQRFSKVIEKNDLLKKKFKIADEVKQIVQQNFISFYDFLNQKPKTSEVMKSLYQLLEKIGVPYSILYLRNQAKEAKNIIEARKHEQTWTECIQIIEEYANLFANQEFNDELFLRTLRSGFQYASYHMAPSTLDQVIVTGMDSVRFEPKKITFVLGLNKDSMPRLFENKTLLTNEERDFISQQLDSARALRPTPLHQQSVEPFVFYKLLTSATDELYFSYTPTETGSNDEKSRSPYLQRLIKAYDLEVDNGHQKQEIRYKNHEFYTIQELLQYVIILFKQKSFFEEFSLEEIKLIEKILHSSYKHHFENLLQSIYQSNLPKQLSKELACALYGKQLFLSVSQVELFYVDPFSHFLRYGLNLKERKELELTVQQTGNLFHEISEYFVRYLMDNPDRMENLSLPEIEQILEKEFQQVKDHPNYQLFEASPRFAFIYSLLQDTLKSSLEIVYRHYQQTKFEPYATELAFGFDKNTRVSIDLGNEESLSIRGKIDRIDAARVDNHLWIEVVDYKSGKKDLHPQAILEGVQLQLLVYLEVAKRILSQKNKKEVHPFGAFYFHLHQPLFQYSDIQDYDNKYLKAYQLQGRLIDDLDLLSKLEEKSSLENFYPYEVKANGIEFKKNSKVINAESLLIMMNYVFLQLKRAGQAILDGKIDLFPLKEDGFYPPSANGEYQPISQFDPTIAGNRYRTFNKNHLSESEIITLMEEKLEEDRN